MADTKGSALTDNAAPARTDEIYVIDDPAGTPASTKADIGSVVDLADHDALTNFVADEHVAHSGVTLTAGNGLTGGGTIAASRTFAVGEGDGIAVAADAVAVDITNATDKASPTGSDELLLADAAASGAIKKSDIQAIADLAKPTESIIVAVSDETTDLTTGTGKITFRMPYAFTLSEVRANVNTAPTGAAIQVDINEAGVSILSTVLSIDVSEKTSESAATAAVISDSSLADDAEISIDIDQVGSTAAGKGLKVALIGKRT